MNTQGKGFTLIEIQITVAILAVLTAVAVPSFQKFIESNQVASRATRFMTALQFMRIEAVKRNTTVRMCQSDQGILCDGDSWQDDWLIWVDSELDGSHEAGDVQEVLRVFVSLSDGVGLDNSRDLEWIGYRFDGTIVGSSGLANSTWTFCPRSGDGEYARKVVINRVGRARRVVGADCDVD